MLAWARWSSRSGLNANWVLQRPNSRGEITLRLADPTEYPAIDPKYFIADPGGTDLVTMIVGVRINRDILAQSPW